MDKATPELVQLGLNMTNYDQLRTPVSHRCPTLSNIVQHCTDVGQHSPMPSTSSQLWHLGHFSAAMTNLR